MFDALDPRTLESARTDAKLSRAELASLAGVNETTILRIEKGEVDPRVEGTWAPIVRVLQKALATPTPRADAPSEKAA